MQALNIKDVAKAIGAECAIDCQIYDICTDTRKITQGCLFIAIKGENFDGHDFAAKALEDGAVAVVCEKDCSLGERQLLVKSTRQALLDAAGYYRSLFNIPVVGITGSVGKTTTKEMTHTVLSTKYKTLKNEANLNNEIGVPLTLLRLDSSYEAAVIEMGMSNAGEIAAITAAVKPDIAIITNIGVSHMENLGSRENILKAKLEITQGMKKGSVLILNGDDDYLPTVDLPDFSLKFFGVSKPDSDITAKDVSLSDSGADFTAKTAEGEVSVSLPVTGIHNVCDSLSAIYAGLKLGISLENAAKALGDYAVSGMRQRVNRINGITVIEDCYNASPDSVKAALSVLSSMNAERKIAVIGDMKELGSITEQAHKNVGIQAAELGIDILLTYGQMAALATIYGISSGVPFCKAFGDKQELAAYLAQTVKEGDAVLFKASRAMRLEEIMNMLYEELKKSGKD